MPQGKAVLVSPMRDIQDRIGVPCIEDSSEERMGLVKDVADLWAKYGPGGTYEPHRKSLLATLKMSLRAQYQKGSVKVSEARLDDEARADLRYDALVAEATTGRAELFVKQAEIEAIDTVIRRGNGIVHYCASEARL